MKTRRTFLIAVCCALAAPLALMAQSLAVTTSLAYDSYIKYEDMPLKVKITNMGGSPFVVDAHGAHIQNAAIIHVKRGSHEFIDQESPEKLPFKHILILGGESADFSVDLTQWFDMSEEGRYIVQVELKRGDEVTASRPLSVNVVNGVEITSITRPLPNYDTEFRKYSLVYWGRAQTETLFLRVIEEPADNCAYLINLGTVLRVHKPQLVYGYDGTLTIVRQVGQDQYARTVIKNTRDGVKILKTDKMLSFDSAMPGMSDASGEPVDKAVDTGAGTTRQRKRPAKDKKTIAEKEEELAKSAGVKLKEPTEVKWRGQSEVKLKEFVPVELKKDNSGQE